MIVAGFGFRAATDVVSLQDAFARAAGGTRVTALATAADKATSPAFRQLAQALALPIHAIAQSDLTSIETQTQSAAALAARETGSVAEASALAAAGQGARLLAPRQISTDRMATCALAQGEPQ